MRYLDCDSEPVRGEEIADQDAFGRLYINEQDQLHYYYGINVPLGGSQDYTPVRAARKMDLDHEAEIFIRLSRGILHLDYGFRSAAYEQMSFKALDSLRVIWPNANNLARYGVLTVEPEQEDEDLSRELFGLSYRELGHFLKDFATLAQFYHPYTGKPKVSCSIKMSHRCDISQAWIPQRFPYVASDEANYFGAHVSLSGFYYFIVYLCHPGESNETYRRLVEGGISRHLLDRIREIPHAVQFDPLVKPSR